MTSSISLKYVFFILIQSYPYYLADILSIPVSSSVNRCHFNWSIIQYYAMYAMSFAANCKITYTELLWAKLTASTVDCAPTNINTVLDIREPIDYKIFLLR